MGIRDPHIKSLWWYLWLTQWRPTEERTFKRQTHCQENPTLILHLIFIDFLFRIWLRWMSFRSWRPKALTWTKRTWRGIVLHNGLKITLRKVNIQFHTFNNVEANTLSNSTRVSCSQDAWVCLVIPRPSSHYNIISEEIVKCCMSKIDKLQSECWNQ